jgi:S-formylglutathione hydrolase
MKQHLLLLALTVGTATFVYSQTGSAPNPSAPVKKGTVEKITVHGKSLEGNLEGDSPDRTVFVYLPPSYATAKNRRYPVVYLLHGYGLTGERWVPFINLPDAPDQDIASGTAKEMILVSPDAFTIYNGSMYSSSPTTGDWETFIAEDLVSYVDSHYRTLANRMSRGLAGHSMGGYGTVRIGMKRPDVFSSLYIMSACCLLNNPGAQGRGGAAAKQAPANAGKGPANPANADKGDKGGKKGRGGFGNVQFAEAAAWSPNPQNPPQFFDLPVKEGEVQPVIAAKWVANSPLVMIDQYATNLKKYHAIAGDCGLQDGLFNSNREMEELFTRLGIAHTFQSYEGDHTNHVKERFQGYVLPFFSENLVFAAAKK